jgi:hypothetical protein
MLLITPRAAFLLAAILLLGAGMPAASGAEVVLFQEDFEGSPPQVMEMSTPLGVWDVGPDNATPAGGHSSPHIAETRPGQDYQNYDIGRLITEEINLAGTTAPRLTFNIYYDTEPIHDGAFIWIWNGSQWFPLSPVGGYPSQCDFGPTVLGPNCWSGKSGAWLPQEVDLSAYAGQQVRIMFMLLADYSITAPGVALDDIRVIDGVPEERGVLDHFKCYAVRPIDKFEPREVTLVDEFGEETVTVLRPTRFCNPVVKCTGESCAELSHPEAHLTCYQIQSGPRNPQFKKRTVVVSNQFGDQQHLVVSAHGDLLCVPSLKSLQGRGGPK